MMKFVLLVGSLAAAMSCSSPLEPGECRNGQDSLGRGPTALYMMTCSPVGSNVQCTAQRGEVGYCADSTRRDVTSEVQWVSSNAAAATFTAPGLLTVVGAGQIEIGFQTGRGPETISGNYAYIVAPGAVPERLADLSVIVRDADNVDRRLANASIAVVPARGPSQACLTNGAGHCGFWISPGEARVRATLEGYEPAETIAPPALPDGALAQRATFDLRRTR